MYVIIHFVCGGVHLSKKFISWNVNGIRACMNKGFMDVFNELDADIFCLQETKMQEGQLVLCLLYTSDAADDAVSV